MMRRFVLFGLSLHRLSVQRIMMQGLLTAGLCLLQVLGVVMAKEPPKVVAVDYPLAYFAERLGGGNIEVLFDVPSGLDPEFWRPDIATLTEIQAADLVVLNGASTAAWTTKVSLSRSRLVDTSASFAGDYIASKGLRHNHGEDGEHTHTGTASYTWLDFDQAAAQAQALAEALKKRLPEITGVDENMSARWLSRDEQNDRLNLALDDEEGATLQQLQGHSITYRIAMGPQAGRKVLTACAARCKQSQLGKKMTLAPASLAGLGDFRCMPEWR